MLTPSSSNINAGAAPVTFLASVQNSTETVTWVYTGTGSINPTSGPATSYTPPASVSDVQSETLTAYLGSSGVNAVATIAVYPADETPPSEPPTDPTDASDPTDPTDATDPTDPTDATDPTDPATAYTLTVTPPTNGKIFSEDMGGGIDCGSGSNDCTADYSAGSTALLTVTPDEGWEVDRWDDDCSRNEDSNACVLTMNSDKTASVTFKLSDSPPAQTVAGSWEGYFVLDGQGAAFTLDLEQTGNNVTGTWRYLLDVPVTGTFDGTTLTLSGTFANTPIAFDITVDGDTMEGTLSNPSTSYPLSATRNP